MGTNCEAIVLLFEHYDLRNKIELALATLLESLSVKANFLKIFQEFEKNIFQYKKHILGVVS